MNPACARCNPYLRLIRAFWNEPPWHRLQSVTSVSRTTTHRNNFKSYFPLPCDTLLPVRRTNLSILSSLQEELCSFVSTTTPPLAASFFSPPTAGQMIPLVILRRTQFAEESQPIALHNKKKARPAPHLSRIFPASRKSSSSPLSSPPSSYQQFPPPSNPVSPLLPKTGPATVALQKAITSPRSLKSIAAMSIS